MTLIQKVYSVLIASVFSLAHGNSLEERIKKHEGNNPCAYIDSSGLLHIGYGHLITHLRLREGDCLPNTVLEAMFQLDLETATNDAYDFIGDMDTFNTLPPVIQDVLIELAYNLGEVRLGLFVKFREAVIKGDWIKAAEELEDSNWYSQVGKRSRYLVSLVREAE